MSTKIMNNSLKDTLKTKRVSFYTKEDNKLKRYNMNSNEEWIRGNVSKDWSDTIDRTIISGFDFVTMTLVNVNVTDILWDELIGYYDNASSWDINQIKTCEEALNLISDSWYNVVKDKQLKTYTIYHRSDKRINSKFFSFDSRGIYKDCWYRFNDTLINKAYDILIPSSFIRQHASRICENRCYGIIHQNYILLYIQKLSNNINRFSK